MRRTVILAIPLFALSMSLQGQQTKGEPANTWNLAYANDENGNKVSGDLRKLINAVKNGEPVRISWAIQHPTIKHIKVEHYADAKFITILNDSTVFAQIDPIVGQTPSVKDKLVTLKENIAWAFSASTLGNNDSMNTNTKTGEIVDHKIFKCGIRWFIRD